MKQNPLFEDGDFALLDTHYYGGIKYYQWVTLPLAIHGVVAKTDGTVVDVQVGADYSDDPVFRVTDLLIHLANDQMGKKASEVVEGEALDVLIGNRPVVVAEGEEAPKEPVKAFAMETCWRRNTASARRTSCPRSWRWCRRGVRASWASTGPWSSATGRDDRVRAYTSLEAQLALADTPLDRASVCILVDKEEIGSVGATGMTSRFFENTVAEIMELAGETAPRALARALRASRMLSSDVSAGFVPGYPSVFEKKNSAFLGRGLVFNKYTGARGKSGSNDASAEYVALVRKIMDDAGVSFQTAELGRVNAGGGGTIAYIPAEYGMDVIDSGVAVLSMHSPWEVTSKADIYEAFKGYKAFALS